MHESEIRCSVCQSSEIIPDVKIVDHGYMDSKHDLAIELQGNPDALFFKDTRKGVLKATVCGACGHVDLSINNAAELLKIYRQNFSD